MINNVTLVGRLVAPPDLRKTPKMYLACRARLQSIAISKMKMETVRLILSISKRGEVQLTSLLSIAARAHLLGSLDAYKLDLTRKAVSVDM
ncbi:single-strand binding protein family [Streptococcus pneumoniae]|nr:single-strand binding protein family [Streptococcus pneumoniae]